MKTKTMKGGGLVRFRHYLRFAILAIVILVGSLTLASPVANAAGKGHSTTTTTNPDKGKFVPSSNASQASATPAATTATPITAAPVVSTTQLGPINNGTC